MASTNPRADWLPIAFSRLIPLPLILFAGALLADWTYAKSATLQWSHFAGWMLLFGLIGCGLALSVAALAARDRVAGGRWLVALVLLVAFAVQIVNFMIHMRDGWTAVVPTGLTLSLVGAALTLAAAWLGREVRR